MAMIDITKLDKLTPEQRDQFNNLLAQFPHLDSKMDTSRELNTPTKRELDAIPQPRSFTEELDYSSFLVPDVPMETGSYKKNEMPSIKVNPEESFLKSFDKEEQKVEASKEQQKDVREQVKKTAESLGIKPEIASFSPEGKTHPILQKMRASVGLRSVQLPKVADVGGCKYGMRALDRQGLVNASVLTRETTNQVSLYETNLEVAILSFSIVEIDGAPLRDIFSIPEQDMVLDQDGKSRLVEISRMDRDERAARFFYIELLKSPNELTEALSIYYQQEFPALELIGRERAKFMCPVENCLQVRIAEKGTVCYCSEHGEQMAQEGDLPNPL